MSQIVAQNCDKIGKGNNMGDMKEYKYEIGGYNKEKFLFSTGEKDCVWVVIYASSEKEALKEVKKVVTREVYIIHRVTEVVIRTTRMGDTEHKYNTL